MSTRTLLFAFFLATALAQDKAGEVRGRVLGSRDGEPLALVQIQLAGTEMRAITGDDGTFQIANVPPGDYALQAASVGYRLANRQFSLAAGESKNLDVVLT